jgi:hypothetical protein
MGWLIHVYSGNAASTQSSIKRFHQKISHFLYETYTRTRIEQLFNIIIGEFMLYIYIYIYITVKAILVTGHEGLLGCEMKRISHFLDS